MAKMPDNIQIIFDNLSGFQKTYCEYRSKGLTQALSAEKAGSEGKDRTALSNIGCSVERLPGVREYVEYLRQERAKIIPIDEVEIITKLRDVYTDAMSSGSLAQANKALELMGTIIGIFGATKATTKKVDTASDAFKDEGVENTTNDRIAKLQSMMKDLNRTTT